MFPHFLPLNRFAVATLFSITSFSITIPNARAQPVNMPSDIQTLLEQGLPEIREVADQFGNAGIVMHKGQIIAQSQSGVRQKGKQDKIQSTDKWHIGSITKSMTASMIGRLVDKNQLDFDATIAELLPNQKSQIDIAWYPVKLIELLQHTSGAKGNFNIPTMLNNSFADETALLQAREKAVLGALSKSPQDAPNTTFAYSNLGYTIAAYIAEQATNKSWETLVQEELFAPLQLTSAGFGAPKGEQPWGHATRFFLFTSAADPQSPGSDNTPIIGPAGTVHMSIRDLAHYGQMHLDALNGSTSFMSATTERRLHTPSELTKHNERYAAGWIIIPPRTPLDGEVLFHNGSNTMWYAFLIVEPKHDIVAAFTTNTGTIEESEAQFGALFQDLLLKME